MEISRKPAGSLYTNETVTLTCDITLNSAVDITDDPGVNVAVTWTGPPGGRWLTSDSPTSTMISSTVYQSNLTLSPLNMTDSGNYTCTASVSSQAEFVEASDNSSDVESIIIRKLDSDDLHEFCFDVLVLHISSQQMDMRLQ